MSATNKNADNTVAVESPDGRDMQGSPGPLHDPDATENQNKDAIEDSEEQTPRPPGSPDGMKGDGSGSGG
jgi:hypothetical protein